MYPRRATKAGLSRHAVAVNHSPVIRMRLGNLWQKSSVFITSSFWLFIKLTAPAVVTGYIAIIVSRNVGREIARPFPGVEILGHTTEILQIWLAAFAGYITSWMAFSFSFAAICSAVGRVAVGDIPSVADCFANVRERTGSFSASGSAAVRLVSGRRGSLFVVVLRHFLAIACASDSADGFRGSYCLVWVLGLSPGRSLPVWARHTCLYLGELQRRTSSVP